MESREFEELIARARGGDEPAIAELLRRFEADVRLMVRVRLPRILRGRFDSMDFVQSVWKSVFAGPDRALVGFESPGHFRGYLAGIVQNKVLEQYRRCTRVKKYELRRERRLYVTRGGREAPREVESGGPTASQLAQAADRMRQLQAGRSPAEARALELRRQGRTFEEIAAETGLHERTIRKLIEAIRDRLEARQWR